MLDQLGRATAGTTATASSDAAPSPFTGEGGVRAAVRPATHLKNEDVTTVPPPQPSTTARESKNAQPLALGWWRCAYASLGLGVIGIVVPGLPTVPFVCCSAFAAARGSQRLHDWRWRTGNSAMIRDWQAHGAVSRRAKCWRSDDVRLRGDMFLTAPRGGWRQSGPR